jgi:inosine/xanthosine triphosphate pyrophosphatase family protein
MWNALGDNFVLETQMADRRTKARAVVGYCDGMDIHVFVGETEGVLINPPRGARKFYWDRVFVPDDPSGKAAGKTYAEIVEDPSLGLEYKMRHLSQSGRAMRSFLEFRRLKGLPELWH